MLKQYKNDNTCSDMFRFTQEPSSGSSPVLSYYEVGFSVLVVIDAVSVMAAYQQVPVSTVNRTPARQADMLP
jgi:hypothetical protein